MKIVLYLLLVLYFTSCNTYLDSNVLGNKISNSYISIEYFENYNFLINKDKVGAASDNQISYPQLFNIKIPKKIKNIKIIDKVFCIEYSSKQFILIDAGFINNEIKLENWKLIDPDKKVIDSYYKNYLEIKRINQNKRVYKIYTDGNTKILLMNIKTDNFENYFTLIKSFKYE